MLLNHPEVAALACDDCETFVIDLDTGTRQQFAGNDIPRPPGSPTPCERCPKCAHSKIKSPTVGRQATLSLRNAQTLQLAMQVKASFGHCLPPEALRDPILSKNLGIVQWVLESHDRELGRINLQATVARSPLR